MITLSIIIFAIAAVFGVVLLTKLLAKKPLARPVVYVHGILAFIALVVLIYFSVQNPGHYPVYSLVLFVIAAIGGFILFANDLRKKPGPVVLALVHGGAAVIAFLLLILFALT